MNVRTRRFVSPGRRFSARSPLIGLLVCAGTAAVLSGCAGGNPFATAPVDPSSTASGDVAKRARGQRDYPSFPEIPRLPADVRPAPAWGQAAADVEAARSRLEQETAPGTWSLTDTAAFASRAQSAAGPELGAPEAGDAEAFARTLRERATPPPPPR